ncbi:MAG: succinate dehydrogenase cytochrome b subunit [Polyangiaceae bacterium]|nr:succinate dehydrogenase cytochrome b subunit [Polyangiaceae bacterium]
MQRAIALYDTSVGKKAVMAVSGAVMFGFVVGHLLGNLQVYLGPAALNGYAEHLQALKPLLWLVRFTLLAAIVLHLLSAHQLWVRGWFARGRRRYRVERSAATTYAGRTMWMSGPLILLFLLYHLAHFTFPGLAMSVGYAHSIGDVYANVVNGFSVWWVAVLYLAAQACLGLHLYHGGASMLQTLGLDHPRFGGVAQGIAKPLAIMIWLGNSSIPVAVLAGLAR